MPTFAGEWHGSMISAGPQLGLDLVDEQGVSGNCLVTLDRAGVWDDALGDPAGLRVEVTVTALSEEEAPRPITLEESGAVPGADTVPAEATP